MGIFYRKIHMSSCVLPFVRDINIIKATEHHKKTHHKDEEELKEGELEEFQDEDDEEEWGVWLGSLKLDGEDEE